jgi:hypothetical protein
LRGWQTTLAAAVDEVRRRLQSEGIDDPVLAATNWALPGEVSFYCAGQPPVYSVGPVLGDRQSQYDLWRPNPLNDSTYFTEQTFIIVGGYSPAFFQGFARVEEPQRVIHYVAGHPIADWYVTVCRGFHGFPKPDKPPNSF